MYELTAFLCGYFHRDRNVSASSLSAASWVEDKWNETEIATLKRTFYAEYIDFFTDRCTVSKLHLDKDMKLEFRGDMYGYHIDELKLYQMPLGMTLYSIRIDMKVDELNAATAVLASLRMIDHYEVSTHHDFVDMAIMPLKNVYDVMVDNPVADIASLIENGNKLRIFQIVNAKDGGNRVEKYEDERLLLYQLGSEVKVTTQADNYSPSEAYLDKILGESSISIFRNWQGLALMDTFTILAHDAVEWLVDNWVSCYFQLIYIHSLFQKCYLFRLNKQLRIAMNEQRSPLSRFMSAMGLSESKMYMLISDFKSFDQHCRFHKISYNFMPLEISAAIDRGLCISEELEQLDTVIDREKQRREEANDRMVNTLLFILSSLTLGSCIWDISCLIDQMFPYADYLGSRIVGYRTVALIVLVVMSFLVARLFRNKHR